MRTYHFISGLPRAGSTLLSSILKQNPRFTTGISDPLHSYTHSIIRDTNSSVGMMSIVPESRQRDLIRDLFGSFYKNGKEVCFNTNRAWAADTGLLKDLFPNFKMIVCLRDVAWILDSFEQLNARNPYSIKPIYHHQELGNVHDRCNMLMGEIPNYGGYVRGPLINVQQSMYSNEINQICYIEYDDLVKNTHNVISEIYDFLEEPRFQHDFNNVEDSYDEFDAEAKIQGLHRVRKSVNYQPRSSILPGELWNRYSPMSFWRSMPEEQRSKLRWITGHQPQPIKRPLINPLNKQL